MLSKLPTLKKYFFILIACLSIGIHAQSIRKYSNEFLNIGVDAASLGMSNAVVATSGDVNSGYWNPAGLTQLEDKQLSLMHASYFANIANYDYGAFAMPLDDKSAIALSIIRFGVDDILDTTELIDADGQVDFNRINLFSTADYAFTFSYARKTAIEGFSYGANAKVVRRIIGDFASSWGFGLDVGVQYRRNNWLLGLMIRDITTTFNAWSINEDAVERIQDATPLNGNPQELPETTEITLPKLQLGLARSFAIKSKFTLQTELDLIARLAETNDIISSSSISATPAFGFQFDYSKVIFLRGGVGNFQDITQFDGSTELGFQPNFGIGFQYKGISIDYALTDIGDQSAAIYSNVFSIKLDWRIFRKQAPEKR